MNDVFAVVLTEHEFFGRVKRSNRHLPFLIVDNDESKTRRLLEAQFPDGWVVIGPKAFLLNGGFDLCGGSEDFEDDFRNAREPTGKAPTVLPYEDKVEAAIDSYGEGKWTAELKQELEDCIVTDFPESELAKFILDTRKEIENGLQGMSAANFAKGDLPIDFVLSRPSRLSSFERLAFCVNSIMSHEHKAKPLKFNDSKKK